MFAIFIVGFVSVAIAFLLRFSAGTPIWLAFVLSVLAALLITAVILPPLKATMIALQYVHKAEEGKLNSQHNGQQ